MAHRVSTPCSHILGMVTSQSTLHRFTRSSICWATNPNRMLQVEAGLAKCSYWKNIESSKQETIFWDHNVLRRAMLVLWHLNKQLHKVHTSRFLSALKHTKEILKHHQFASNFDDWNTIIIEVHFKKLAIQIILLLLWVFKYLNLQS
jgi:hypothetical protein